MSPTRANQQIAATPDMRTIEEKILDIATDAFDDKEKAQRWLHQPNIQLANRLPVELIDTPEGFQTVETVLGQIKYAILA